MVDDKPEQVLVRGRVRLHAPTGLANASIPCGRCIGCKTRRSQEWAARVVHETRYHDSNLFLTLTYDPEHLPEDGQLKPRDLCLFLKKLRKAASRRRGRNPHIVGNRVRYLACGEYGDTTGRPHYHAILFGVGFADERIATSTLKESPTLSKLWGKGAAYYGTVTMASAAYVAGYTVKKMGATHCDADGVVMEPPFLRCSTRPGIGAEYAHRYMADFHSGSLVVDGEHRALPRYYKKIVERDSPQEAEEIAHRVHTRQQERVTRDAVGALPERLVAGEAIMKRRQELTRNHIL